MALASSFGWNKIIIILVAGYIMREWEYVIVFLTEVKLLSEGSFHCDILSVDIDMLSLWKKFQKVLGQQCREKNPDTTHCIEIIFPRGMSETSKEGSWRPNIEEK